MMRKMEHYKQPLKSENYGKIVDSHVHLVDIKKIKKLVSYSKQYGVNRWLGITKTEKKNGVDLMFDNTFKFALFLNRKNLASPDHIKDTMDEIEIAYAEDFVALKLWMPPRFKTRFNAKTHNFINNEALYPAYELMEDLEFVCLWHIADPDIWYETIYTDKEKYGTKKSHLKQIKAVAQRFSKLNIVIPHFGGNPENLDDLHETLSNYKNIYIDTAGTKWIVRELSRQPKKAKKFIERHDDRILFGTDLVLGHERPTEEFYYCTRYWAQQALLQGDNEWESPIKDPDNDNKPVTIHGLQIKESSLQKIYYKNAEHLYGF